MNWWNTCVFVLSTAVVSSATVIPTDKEHVISLDGIWRFKLEQARGDYESKGEKRSIRIDYPEVIEPFYQLDYTESEGWHDLKVPGNWEMAGYSPATYNQPDNASGFYRLRLDIPRSWEGGLVKVDFDGVQNGAEIWLNGQKIKVDESSWGRDNYHESGWTAFQADLTPLAKFGRENLLAVRVTKNTKSVDLDTGDYFFLGGIHRSVTLFSVPRAHIENLTVQTHLPHGGLAEVRIIAQFQGADAGKVSARLKDGPASTMKVKGGKCEIILKVTNPRLWSAEFPNLYELTVELLDVNGGRMETCNRRVGIREVSIKDAVLLLNGKPVKMAGMCRHEVSAADGTAVGPEIWRKDIELMKAANVNAIRTSHYPYGGGFYDLCDELGMYVVDELPYCWTPTNDKNMEPAFLQRARETIRRDKNHPSVIIWAIGNENKEGRNLQTVADLVKELDDTRPRAVSWFGGEKYNTELSDSHYTVPDAIEMAAKRAKKDGHPHTYLENPNDWDVRLGADPGCWDLWASVLQRCWDVVAREETLPGSFLWEWQDRAIADKSPTKLCWYFPETGIQLLKIKGIVDGFRNPRPWHYHVKMIYSPIRVGEKLERNADEVSFDVENRFSFTDLAQINAKWQLLSRGKVIDSGELKPNIAPLSRGKVSVKLAEAAEKADALRVDFEHPSGRQIVAHQFTLADSQEGSAFSTELPQGLAFPQFNLVTRVTQRDPGFWRKATRFRAKLIDVKEDLKSLEANIVMKDEPERVVGRIHAAYGADNRFTYRVEWSGPKSEVQELGWIFTMPKSHDRFSWKRDALWTVYPEGHIGRPGGTARPDTMNVSLTKITRPDAFDFNSTKYNCSWASLTDESGQGLRVQFTANAPHHCRGGATQQGYTLTVNKQVSPPNDLSTKVVPDLYMTLKPGDTIEGSFTVGSNKP